MIERRRALVSLPILSHFCFSFIKAWSTIKNKISGTSGKELACHLQCKKCRFDPWVRKIRRRQSWQPVLQYSRLENPIDRIPGGLWSIDLQRVGQDWSDLVRTALMHTKNTTWWFDSCVHCEIIITSKVINTSIQFSSVQSLSRVQLFVIPWIAACQASLSITNCQSLPKPISIESVMPSNHLILCRPLLLLPSIFPGIRVFSNESALCIRWPKYWSFSFKISPFNKHPGLISFMMDWLDLLAVQGTLKSLLQHHSSKVSILWHSAFFIVQLSHPYMTTRKTIALTRRTFVDRVMSLLFNYLRQLPISFFVCMW